MDIGAGIAQAGTDLSKIAGLGALEEQKAAAEKEKLTLMDQLATTREATGRADQSKYDMIKQKGEQDFKGPENEKDRQAKIKESTIHAGAVLGASANAAGAHVKAQQIASDALERIENVRAQTLLDVNKSHDENRVQVAQLKQEAIQARKDASQLSPELLDIYSDSKIMTGEYPALGYGGKDVKVAIDEEVARKAKAANMTTEQLLMNKTISKSAEAPLVALTKVANIATGQAQTAHDSAQMILDLIDKDKATMGPAGVPLIDRYIQAGRKLIPGDERVKELDSLINSFMTETSKVISGNTGAAGVAVTMDANLQKRLSDFDNEGTLKGVLNIYDLENRNRIKNYGVNLEALRKQRATGQTTPLDQRALPTQTKSNPTGAFQLPDKVEDMVNGRKYVMPDGSGEGMWDANKKNSQGTMGTLIPAARPKEP